jgi:hypothetical protein
MLTRVRGIIITEKGVNKKSLDLHVRSGGVAIQIIRK